MYDVLICNPIFMGHFQNARTCICEKSIGMSYSEDYIFGDHFVEKGEILFPGTQI
jgi:hypothetical protein